MSLKILVTITFLVGSCTVRSESIVSEKSFAKDNQFPYQVAIFIYGVYSCSGSIYSEKFVLTAANCMFNTYASRTYEYDYIKVLVGTTNYKTNGTYYKVKSVVRHENYKRNRNDIAIMEIKKSFQFNKAVQPIGLYTGKFPPGKNVTVTGWSQTESGFMVPYLKYYEAKAYTQPQCGKDIKDDYGGFICIEQIKYNEVCFRDSGSPAMFDGKLVGIKCSIISMCGSTTPDTYTYVPFYIDWIKKHTV